MTKTEFCRHYKRLENMYGVRNGDHLDEWFLQFGDKDPSVFSDEVTQVIGAFRPFGQDKWPTPGEFNNIINPVDRGNGPGTISEEELERRKRLDWERIKAKQAAAVN